MLCSGNSRAGNAAGFQKELQEEAWLHSLASAPLVNDAAFSKQTNKSFIAVASSLLMD